MKKVIWGLFLVLTIGLAGCGSSPVVTRATGMTYEVMVVMDQTYWDGAVGDAVHADLTTPVSYLPQEEPSFDVSYSAPEKFDSFLKFVRNIVMVEINPASYTKAALKYENDKWAAGQVVATLKAPDTTAVIDYLAANPHVLSDFFTKVELNRAISIVEKTYSTEVYNIVKEKQSVGLKVPEKFDYYNKEKDDFFWATNNAASGRMDVVVYSFPYVDKETFTPEYLVAKRDSVMKENLPGSFPGSYMATEKRFGVGYEAITLHGKYCGVMRGLWKMQGDMMGGPFVSHIRLDEENNKVVVAEGFVYAPETNKRNYIRRMEASLFTLRLPGEYEEPAEASLMSISEK